MSRQPEQSPRWASNDRLVDAGARVGPYGKDKTTRYLIHEEGVRNDANGGNTRRANTLPLAWNYRSVHGTQELSGYTITMPSSLRSDRKEIFGQSRQQRKARATKERNNSRFVQKTTQIIANANSPGPKMGIKERPRGAEINFAGKPRQQPR